MQSMYSLTSHVENAINSEDLVPLIGTDWLIASSMADASKRLGCLYAVDRRKKTCQVFYGADAYARDIGLDQLQGHIAIGLEVYARGFSPHGIALRQSEAGDHTLYVVCHYPFDAIEVFGVHASRSALSATWIESLRLPPGTSGNDLVALPDGGLAVTNMMDPADAEAIDKMHQGVTTGYVLEWRRDIGWSPVPDSEMSGPNGIEVSPDGEWLFVSSWSANKSLVRISRGARPAQRKTLRTNLINDNLSWTSDGKLLVTGQFSTPIDFMSEYRSKTRLNTPFAVLNVDPETMNIAETVIHHDGHDGFGAGTVAVEIDEEIWVGTSRGATIGCFSKVK
jgi:hypothetical protein